MTKIKEQNRVDNIFNNQSKVWQEAYLKKNSLGVIIKKRQAVALEYIDGLSLPKTAHVLEIGCGAGFMTIALAERGFKVEAIDHARSMVGLTQQFAFQKCMKNKIHATVGDAHKLKFPDNSFDVVVALGVIHWLPDPKRATQQISRVLVPGGYAVLSNNRCHALLNPYSISVVTKILYRARVSIMCSLEREPPLYSNKEFNHHLQSAGLSVIKETSVGFGPFHLLRKLTNEETEMHIQEKLQQFSQKGYPILRSAGSQYIVLAKKCTD